MTAFHLDFFVIGAQKCATSWMYYCLNEHPEINLPRNKMEIGYIGGSIFQEKGEAWFFDRFPEKQTAMLTGDVSVDYLLDSNTPANIQPYVKKPRFIAVLREPVDRMISAYFWSVRKKQLPNRNIEDVLQKMLKNPSGILGGHPNHYMDELVRRAFYGEQLEPFVSTYGKESLLIFLYEEICNNPEQVVQKIYKFLGVDPLFVPSSLKVRPKVNSYNPFLLRLQNLIRIKAWAKALDHANRFLVKKRGRKEPVSMATRVQLRNLFQPHIAKTEQLLLLLPEDQRPTDCNLTKIWSNADYEPNSR